MIKCQTTSCFKIPCSQADPLKPVAVQSHLVVMNLFRHVPLLRQVFSFSHLSIQPGAIPSEFSTIAFLLFPRPDGYSNNSMSAIHPKNLVRRITEGWVSLFALSLVGSPPKYIGLLMINRVFSGLLIVDFHRLSTEIVVIPLFFSNNTWCHAKSFKFSPTSVAIAPDLVPWLHVNSNLPLDSSTRKKFVCPTSSMYSSSAFASIVLKRNPSPLVSETFHLFTWRNEVRAFVSVSAEAWLSVNETQTYNRQRTFKMAYIACFLRLYRDQLVKNSLYLALDGKYFACASLSLSKRERSVVTFDKPEGNLNHAYRGLLLFFGTGSRHWHDTGLIDWNLTSNLPYNVHKLLYVLLRRIEDQLPKVLVENQWNTSTLLLCLLAVGYDWEVWSDEEENWDIH